MNGIRRINLQSDIQSVTSNYTLESQENENREVHYDTRYYANIIVKRRGSAPLIRSRHMAL